MYAALAGRSVKVSSLISMPHFRVENELLTTFPHGLICVISGEAMQSSPLPSHLDGKYTIRVVYHRQPLSITKTKIKELVYCNQCVLFNLCIVLGKFGYIGIDNKHEIAEHNKDHEHFVQLISAVCCKLRIPYIGGIHKRHINFDLDLAIYLDTLRGRVSHRLVIHEVCIDYVRTVTE